MGKLISRRIPVSGTPVWIALVGLGLLLPAAGLQGGSVADATRRPAAPARGLEPDASHKAAPNEPAPGVAAPSAAAGSLEEDSPEWKDDSGLKVPYEVQFAGISEGPVLSLVRSVCDSVALVESPPATLSLLKQRAVRDSSVIRKALRSRGYYGGAVTSDVDSSRQPHRVRFEVTPGRQYLLRSIQVRTQGVVGEAFPLPTAATAGLAKGQPALSADIASADDKLLQHLGKYAHPQSAVTDRQVRVIHADHAVDVIFDLEAGPAARFGELRIETLVEVDEAFVRAKVPWKVGEPFDTSQLRVLASRLTATHLFGSVRVVAGEQVDDQGLLPVIALVSERRHRTLEASGTFTTDVGAGGRVSWQNRNHGGTGQQLTMATELTGIGFNVFGNLRKPDFGRRKQHLVLDLKIGEDSPLGFTSRNVGLSAQIERNLGTRHWARVGLGLKVSEVEQFGVTDDFAMISLPLEYWHDNSNNLLDPTGGYKVDLKVTPFLDPRGDSDLSFLKTLARLTAYHSLDEEGSLVLAGRTSVGSLSGASRLDIPADERFFAGGGGSVRGYGFNTLGPNDGLQTRGGRSLLELSLELRYKFNDTFGLVGFFDGGGAFTAELPDLDGDIRYGAGVGFRYYTPIGPVRIDVGFPLDKRTGIDSDYELYFSVGQAF